MLKERIFNKPVCIIWLLLAFVYGLALPFFRGNNPASELGTLSLLCEDRKAYFWLWGILTGGGIIANTQYMYNKFSYKNKFFDALCTISFISMCFIALTLGHSIEDWNPKRIAHWVATGVFIALTVAPILLFFLKNIKLHKQFTALALCTVGILMTFVVIFVFIGKSALMEMIPIALIEVFLFVVNFTRAVKAQKLEEAVISKK